MDQVEEIKQKTDIVSAISEYVDLKKSGRNFKGLCPFHTEKTSSFMVSPELQIYKCFGCFPAGQAIKTPFGYHPIEDIVKGEYVFSGKGNYQKVEAKYEKNYKGDLVSLRLSKLTEEVSLTGDHEVFIIGGSSLYENNYKYLSRKLNKYKKYSYRKRIEKLRKYTSIKKIEARKLKKGMTLLYPVDTIIKDLEYIDLHNYIDKKWPAHGKKPLFPHLNVRVDEKLLRIIGYYIAEGSNHRAYVRFSLGNHEKDFVADIVRLMKTVFGIEGSIHKRSVIELGLRLLFQTLFWQMFLGTCVEREPKINMFPM